MEPYVIIHKQIGETPLQALEAWRATRPDLAGVPLTYAGRLDPMAEGALLILIGEECKNQAAYHGLDKEYEIEVVLDLATDTGDVLGIASYAGIETKITASDVSSILPTLIGTTTVPYPAFSSKPVHGKPLFQYALEGTLDTIDIPTHEETIYDISTLSVSSLSSKELKARIDSLLTRAPRETSLVGEDFRQDKVRAAWDDLFTKVQSREFATMSLRVSCASGTYMRTLASRVGDLLSTSGFALSINRTSIHVLK